MTDTVDRHSDRPRRRQRQHRKCPECGQVFYKAEHLDRHVRSHTKERPFGCDICGKTYSRHDSLLRHARSHGPESDDMEATPSQSSSHPTTTLPDIPSPTEPVIMVRQDHQTTCNPRDQTAYMSDVSMGDFMDLGPVPFADTGLGHETFDPLWLLGGDFDMDSLNMSVAGALPEWNYQQQQPPATSQTQNPTPIINPDGETPVLPPSVASAVHAIWYSRVKKDDIAQRPPPWLSSGEHDEVDDSFRQDLSTRLQPPMTNSALPSADFMNLAIKLYFSRFNTVFPLIHAPSFRPSSQSALVLLSITSVGALFIGSASAASQGRKIFQILNKSNLASWESYCASGSREALGMCQASLIGQTFAILSGYSQDLLTADSFHGAVLALARQLGLFKVKHPMARLAREISKTASAATEPLDLNKQWKVWIEAEESARLVLGLHMHDAELAMTYHHDPLLRHSIDRLPTCSSDRLFAAPTAEAWHALVVRDPEYIQHVSPPPPLGAPPPISPTETRPSIVHLSASLSSILASAVEDSTVPGTDSSVEHYRKTLLGWYNDHESHIMDSISGNNRHHHHQDATGLLVLWHEAFMALYVDFDHLELAIGRNGEAAATRAAPGMRAWATSPGRRRGPSPALRGVLHAFSILKQLEMRPVGLEVGLYVPKALFLAALTIYCYVKFGGGGEGGGGDDHVMGLPELRVTSMMMMTQQNPSSSSSYSHAAEEYYEARLPPPHYPSSSSCPQRQPPVIDLGLLCRAVDFLRLSGRWGISKRYAAILEKLLDGETGCC